MRIDFENDLKQFGNWLRLETRIRLIDSMWLGFGVEPEASCLQIVKREWDTFLKKMSLVLFLKGRNSLSSRRQQHLGYVSKNGMMPNGGQMQPENLLNDPLDVSDEEEQQYTDDERSPLSEPIYGGRYLSISTFYSDL